MLYASFSKQIKHSLPYSLIILIRFSCKFHAVFDFDIFRLCLLSYFQVFRVSVTFQEQTKQIQKQIQVQIQIQCMYIDLCPHVFFDSFNNFCKQHLPEVIVIAIVIYSSSTSCSILHHLQSETEDHHHPFGVNRAGTHSNIHNIYLAVLTHGVHMAYEYQAHHLPAANYIIDRIL